MRYGGRKLLIVALAVTFLFLQKSLWLGNSTVGNWLEARASNAEQATENTRLSEVNQRLTREIEELTGDSGMGMVEELAREELDMVRKDEIFFRFVRQTPQQ